MRETIPTAGADPRAAHPGRRRRRGLSVVEDAPPARADRGGRGVLRHRGAGAGVPRAAWRRCSTTCPRTTLCVVEDPEAVARRGAPAASTPPARGAPPPAASSTAWRCPPSDFVLGEDEAAAALGGAARGSSCAPVEIVARQPGADGAAARPRRVGAAHHPARRAAAARAPRAARADGSTSARPLRDRLRALARRRLARPRRRAQPHARRAPGWRCCAPSGLAADLAPPRAGRELLRSDRRRAAGGADRPAAARLRLPADRLVLVAEEEIFGARARMREAPRQQGAGARRPRRARRGRPGRPRRARRRPLPRPEEADRCAASPQRLPAPRVRRRHALPAGLPLGEVQRYVGAEGRRAAARQAGRRDLAGEAPARSRPRRARSPRSCCSSTRSARRCPATRFPPAGRDLPRVRGDVPVRGDARSGARRSTTCSPTCRARAPMDRLVCGDVGYGKTEVALRASLLAVLGGKQVAVLAPTTVLVEQHFRTFTERFARLPGARRRAVALPAARPSRSRRWRRSPRARSTSSSAPTACCRATCASRTSACSSIDEEQRFGVDAQGADQEAAHAGRRADADRDADPAHAADGDGRAARPVDHRDAARRSAARSAPSSAASTPTLMREAIERELARGGQVFFVHNRRRGHRRELAQDASRELVARGDAHRRSATARCPRASSRR